jgi:hypothetical protein
MQQKTTSAERGGGDTQAEAALAPATITTTPFSKSHYKLKTSTTAVFVISYPSCNEHLE